MIQSKEFFNYMSQDDIIRLRIMDDIHNYVLDDEDDEDEEGDD